MMTPNERQLVSDLFDRVRAAERNPRDQEAEAYIARRAQEAPNAAYTLAQVVLVQEQALAAAQRRIEELEAQLAQARAHSAPDNQGGFLGGLSSLFGGAPGRPAPPAPRPAAAGQAWGRDAASPAGPPPQAYGAPGFGAGPWGAAAAGAQAGPWSAPPRAGGGFLSGALTTAAGVAGGMLLANSIQGLFHSSPHAAHMAGLDASSLAGGDLQNLPPLDAPFDPGLSGAGGSSDASGLADQGYQNAQFGGDGGYDDGGSDV